LLLESNNSLVDTGRLYPQKVLGPEQERAVSPATLEGTWGNYWPVSSRLQVTTSHYLSTHHSGTLRGLTDVGLARVLATRLTASRTSCGPI